jgi:putative PIN family toxin of toxin-antitoxin system
MSTRAVFDCMVFLQAVTNKQGPAFACVSLVEQAKLELVVSPAILAEVGDVLSRPKVRAKFPHLTDERVEGFLHWLEDKAIALAEVPQVFEYRRDPDDEPYVNLAIVSDARYLVSRDKDLLDLMADEDFRRRFPNLTILNPVALLQQLALERLHEQKPEKAPQRERGQDINHY